MDSCHSVILQLQDIIGRVIITSTSEFRFRILGFVLVLRGAAFSALALARD